MGIIYSFLLVTDLNLAGTLEQMTDTDFDDYLQMVNVFIDDFPELAAKMSSAHDLKSYEDLKKLLMDVSSALPMLHADNLAEECRSLLASLDGSIDHDSFEASLENFIHSVNTLSIDVQMAMRGAGSGLPPPQPPAEDGSAPDEESEPNPDAEGETDPDDEDEPKHKILAVDNMKMFHHILRQHLQKAPYEIHCVDSGLRALRYLELNPRPDLILLDIDMPGMNGFELARKIKKAGISSPIIFVTANSEREHIDKAIEVGAVGLIAKPLRNPQLQAKIEEHL